MISILKVDPREWKTMMDKLVDKDIEEHHYSFYTEINHLLTNVLMHLLKAKLEEMTVLPCVKDDG